MSVKLATVLAWLAIAGGLLLVTVPDGAAAKCQQTQSRDTCLYALR